MTECAYSSESVLQRMAIKMTRLNWDVDRPPPATKWGDCTAALRPAPNVCRSKRYRVAQKSVNLLINYVECKAVPAQAWICPEASRIIRQSANEGGKIVSPTHRPSLPPGRIAGNHFCWSLSRPQGHSAARRIKSLKNFKGPIRNMFSELFLFFIFIWEWLRHCATSREVSASIPSGVTGDFFWGYRRNHVPWGRLSL
jgi:hypothetical protein